MGLNLALFLKPLATGCLYALLLPLLGALLRFQDKWWMALAIPYLGLAAGLAGAVVGIPPVIGAPMGAIGGALVQRIWEAKGDSGYAFMILLGSVAIALIPPDIDLGGRTAQALVEGHLLITGPLELRVGGLVLLANLIALPWLMPRLIRARLFPAQMRANQSPVAYWHLGIAVLAALTLAEGVLSLGIMGTFALTVVPPWIGFRLAPNWRWSLILSATLGLVAYLGAFALAIGLERPFTPVLVGLLVILAGLVALVRPARG